MSKVRHAVCAVTLAALVGACSVSSDPEAGSKGPDGSRPGDRAADAPVRGVTDDTIRLGVATIDVNRVRDEFGVNLGGLPEEVIPALVAATNEAGGISGRQVEVVQEPILPVGADDSERACRELIEDEQVFAVLGMMIGDAPLCVTENYQTPYVALWGLDEERQQRSVAPFISLFGTNTLRLNAEALVDEGTLDGRKVAVYFEGTESPEVVESQLVATLEEAGIEVVSSAQLPNSGDAVRAANDIDRIFERFQADGADTVVTAGAGAGVMVPALGRTSWSPQLVFLDNGQYTGEDALGRFGLTDPAELRGAIAVVGQTTSDDLVDDPMLADCFDRINAHSELGIVAEDIYPETLRPGSPGYAPVVQACQLWDMAVHVLTAAGDDPSAQSIIDGLAGDDDFALPGYPEASLSPERWGAVEATRSWHFDEGQVRFVPDGPIEVVE